MQEMRNFCCSIKARGPGTTVAMSGLPAQWARRLPLYRSMQGDRNFGIYRGTSPKDFNGLLRNAERTFEGSHSQLRLLRSAGDPCWPRAGKMMCPDLYLPEYRCHRNPCAPICTGCGSGQQRSVGSVGKVLAEFCAPQGGLLAAVELIITNTIQKEDRNMVLSIREGGDKDACLGNRRSSFP